MIQYKEGSRGVTFAVRIIPRASTTEIVGEHNGALKIRIAAPPVEGAANRELVRFLAKTLKVSQTAVEIVSGANSRNKIVRINDVNADTLDRLTAFK